VQVSDPCGDGKIKAPDQSVAIRSHDQDHVSREHLHIGGSTTSDGSAQLRFDLGGFGEDFRSHQLLRWTQDIINRSVDGSHEQSPPPTKAQTVPRGAILAHEHIHHDVWGPVPHAMQTHQLAVCVGSWPRQEP
jgi:hypothetical protein